MERRATKCNGMKVLVIDDHPIVRMGLVQLIRTHWPSAVIGEGESLADGRRAVAHAPPDVITLDLSLPDAQGIEALTQLLRSARGVPILVLSQGAEATHAQRVMQMGAAGYVEKSRAADDLVEAMSRVLSGRRYVAPTLANQLLTMLDGGPSQTLPHEALTAQEYRVMQLIASGLRPSQIATTMNLSVKTVGNYRARLLKKGGWRNNVELTKYCLEHGLTSTR